MKAVLLCEIRLSDCLVSDQKSALITGRYLVCTISILGLGDNFGKYLSAFQPFLMEGLRNSSEYQVSFR